MSAVQFIVKSIQDMSQADRESVFAAFAMDPPMASPKAAPKSAAKATKEPKAPKKPRANAGIGNAWTAFCSKVQQDNKGVIDAVKAEAAAKRAAAKLAGLPAPAETQGAHLHWCKSYRDTHEAEWKAFEAAWKEAHPKGASAAATATTAENSDDAATVVDDEAPAAAVGGGGSVAAAAAPAAAPADAPKKRGPKKMADMTPEEQAAAKAKRAENKAKKAASANNSAEGSRASSPPKVKDD
jgi:hypothetical protein